MDAYTVQNFQFTSTNSVQLFSCASLACTGVVSGVQQLWTESHCKENVHDHTRPCKQHIGQLLYYLHVPLSICSIARLLLLYTAT